MKPESVTRIAKALGFSVLLLVIATAPALAKKADVLKDRMDIADLITCYAHAADTIGSGKTQSDPKAAGLAIIRTCFTEDATIAIWPVGMPFDREVFPTRTGDKPPAIVLDSPAAWAEMVDSAFRSAGGVGYDFVQHLVSNVKVEVNGDEGKLLAYVLSTHIIQGAQPFTPSRCHQQSNGTYSSTVKKIDGVWKITSFDLTQIAYEAIVETGAGCAAPAP